MKFQKEADKLYSKLWQEEVNEEVRFYKKREVFPILNKDGSINKFNLLTGGSWLRLIGTIILIGIIVGFIFEYHKNLQTCTDVISQLNIRANLASNFSRSLNITIP